MPIFDQFHFSFVFVGLPEIGPNLYTILPVHHMHGEDGWQLLFQCHIPLTACSSIYIAATATLYPAVCWKCHLIFFPYRPGLTSMQHTASHTTTVQPSSHNRWYVLIGKQWYQLPVLIPTNSKFWPIIFWPPQLHQHLHPHSACHLGNKTYPLTPTLHWPQYPALVTGFKHLYKWMTSSLSTCYPLYHCISCVPISDNYNDRLTAFDPGQPG